jgi:hypothetical protein
VDLMKLAHFATHRHEFLDRDGAELVLCGWRLIGKPRVFVRRSADSPWAEMDDMGQIDSYLA